MALIRLTLKSTDTREKKIKVFDKLKKLSKEVTENDLLTTRTSYHHGFLTTYLPELTTIVYVFDRDLAVLVFLNS